jgi:ribosomal protein L37AE/L43A
VSPTNRVDVNQEGANMYGVMPCPKCKSEYRYPRKDGLIWCDDCGFKEKADS